MEILVALIGNHPPVSLPTLHLETVMFAHMSILTSFGDFDHLQVAVCSTLISPGGAVVSWLNG